MRKFVFGMGTGCCGTASLAWLLNSQDDAFVGHELFPILPWSTSIEARNNFAENKWEQLNHESHLYGVVGDVATYYLPYVRFLLHNLEELKKDEIDFKFIILRRDKAEVISAFQEKFKRQKNNPLQNVDNVEKNNWDNSFPEYNSNIPLETAIECYWEDYYSEAEWLVKYHPKKVRIFETEDLNNEEKVLEILRFAGIRNPKLFTGIRKNKRNDASNFD
jgi:hypothetical protein